MGVFMGVRKERSSREADLRWVMSPREACGELFVPSPCDAFWRATSLIRPVRPVQHLLGVDTVEISAGLNEQEE